MVKLESDIWSNLNMWSNCCLYIWSKPNIWSNFICSNSNTWSNESYGRFPHIWSNMQQIYGQNLRKPPYIIVTDMTYLLVNWTDVTSTESAFSNKISDRAHKRSFTRYVVSFTDPPPLGTWPSRSRYNPSFVGLARGTRY